MRANNENLQGERSKFNLIQDFVGSGQGGSRPPQEEVMSLSLEVCKESQKGGDWERMWGPPDSAQTPTGSEEPVALKFLSHP